MTRSASSFNFSDISKIDETNQTPGGFYSIVRPAHPRHKYHMEVESEYGLSPPMSKRVAMRSFEMNSSLQTLDAGPQQTHRINKPYKYHTSIKANEPLLEKEEAEENQGFF